MGKKKVFWRENTVCFSLPDNSLPETVVQKARKELAQGT